MTRCRRSARSLWSFLTVLALLAGFPSVSTAQRDADASFESRLDAVAKKESHGPIVATLHAPESPSSARSEYDSLGDLARAYGLTLLKQDDINVIGPAERVDFRPLFDGSLPVKRAPEYSYASLVLSLTEEQFLAMGIPAGLSFPALTPHQQSLVRQLFSGDNELVKHEASDDEEPRILRLPAAEVAPEFVTLRGWLDMSVTVKAPLLELNLPDAVAGSPAEGRSLPDAVEETPGYEADLTTETVGQWHGDDGDDHWSFARKRLKAYYGDSYPEATMPGELVANTLKESHLDYSLPSLRAPLSFSGRTSLKEFVEQAKEESGLDLRASPGSENVLLYIHAVNIEAGELLKAVSLATTGTWRKFDQSYLFTVDLAGIGQIAAVVMERSPNEDSAMLSFLELVDTLSSRPDLISRFPIRGAGGFTFSAEQIAFLLNRSVLGSGEEPPQLPWAMLSPRQQAALRGLCEIPVLPEPDDLQVADANWWMVEPSLDLSTAVDVPVVGRVGYGEGLPLCPADDDILVIMRAARTDAPADLRVPLNAEFRALVCDPSPREKPSTLVSTCARHGFNAIFLRVFTGGCTAFPGKQFPMMPKLEEDYLAGVVSAARSKGLKVYGVVDVLRWSDGSPKHWLAERTDLLDYNIFGLTYSQWAGSLVHSDLERGFAELHSGSALEGELVSPFHPDVEVRLKKMLEELSAYGLDGLVLDHISQSYAFIPMMSDSRRSSGILGHNPIARKTFFEAHGADSVDIPDTSPYLDVLEAPGSSLYPIVRACRNLTSEWTRRHRDKTTDLVCALTKRWADLKQTGPIWLVDESAGGLGRLDWSKLKDQTDHVVYSMLWGVLGRASSTSVGAAMVHGSDHLGTMFFALVLAEELGYKFSFPTPEIHFGDDDSEGIVIDLTSAPRKKSAYLRILAPPEPDWEKKKAVEAE